MNYDKMSVEELLPLYNWNIINATLGKITEDAAGRKGFELFTAIRRAVVREASVGKLVFGTREIPDVVNPDLSHIENTIRFDWCENKRHPDALTEDLLLIPIPKETP